MSDSPDTLSEDEVLWYLTPGERKKLDQLEPETRGKVVRVVAGMYARGFLVAIGQTIRSVAEQLDALARGTTSSGQKLTWHFLGRAIDFRRRLDNGTPDPSDDKPDPTTSGDDSYWIALYEEATAAGLHSLAYEPGENGKPKRDARGRAVKLLLNGGKLWDAGHCENRGMYASLTAATRAERPELIT